MMLYCQFFEQKIIFRENETNVLYLENKFFLVKLLASLCQQLYKNEQEEEIFVLSHEHQPLNLVKNAELIIDPFNLDFNHRKIINHIYENLSQVALTDDYYQQTQQLTSELVTYLHQLIANYNIDLQIVEQINVLDLLKIAKVSINTDDHNLLEKIINYAQIAQEVLSVKILILVNLKIFLTDQELEQFYQEMYRRKIHLLLIEANFERQRVLPSEKNLIIDQDLCEIYLE